MTEVFVSARRLVLSIGPILFTGVAGICDAVARSYAIVRLHRLHPTQRRGVAIAGSLLLHGGLFLLLMPSAKGMASLGTIGEGGVDGAGTSVTLVDASELLPPEASETQSSGSLEEAGTIEAAVPETATEMVDLSHLDEGVSEEGGRTASEMEKRPSVGQPPSDSVMEAGAGAHGQNGQANTDLWNAIAPCWNRLADDRTLSATLTISLAGDGGLAVAPVIDRDLDAAITDQTLQSEAKALAALSECGPYPVAGGQQNVTIVFPSPVAQ